MFKLKLPDSTLQLSTYRSECLYELLSLMTGHEQVSGILLGGSLSYKNDFSKSDIDLFCLINDTRVFENNIHKILSTLNDVDEIIFQGFFPWTEKLYTIYFNQDADFSIDLCLIDTDHQNTFFWEPDGYILLDKENAIESNRAVQKNSPNFTRQPFLKSNPFSFSVVTIKKIEKNIARGHLWNALEQLNSLRRYVMQIIRLSVLKDDYFLGRVDRDIEDVISEEINLSLIKTIATYDAKDIAQKSIMLIKILLELKKPLENSKESEFKDWIIKQLKHEENKLSKLF